MATSEVLSEFEDLLKLKEFYRDKKKEPYECTYELISHALKNEYIDNIDTKIERWVNITHVLYFKDVFPIKYYFQAKMLFRDGFYEAAIMLSRSICEMICYEMLKCQKHPFGDYKEIELENFRTLAKYLALPKTIDKQVFEKHILAKLASVDDRNFLKSSYHLDPIQPKYLFRIESGKTAKNLNRYFRLFETVAFTQMDNFSNNSFKIINRVYDNGNTYIHARKSPNSPKDDATNNLNGIGEVLYELYGASINSNQHIKSGYTDFPDICTGMNFALYAYATPEDAIRGYLNLPSRKQIERLLTAKGVWEGEWQNKGSKNKKGKLTFYIDGEYMKADLIYKRGEKAEITEPLDIKLFGDYFRIRGFDKSDMKHKCEKHVHFELEFFSEDILIGKHLPNKGNVIFKRIE